MPDNCATRMLWRWQCQRRDSPSSQWRLQISSLAFLRQASPAAPSGAAANTSGEICPLSTSSSVPRAVTELRNQNIDRVFWVLDDFFRARDISLRVRAPAHQLWKRQAICCSEFNNRAGALARHDDSNPSSFPPSLSPISPAAPPRSSAAQLRTASVLPSRFSPSSHEIWPNVLSAQRRFWHARRTRVFGRLFRSSTFCRRRQVRR